MVVSASGRGGVRAVLRELLEHAEFAIGHVPGRVGVRLRAAWFARRLGGLGARASFGIGVHVTGARAIVIGKEFGCGRYCVLAAGGDGGITVGDRVNLNTNVALNASVRGRIIVGDDVIVGPNTVLRASDHVAAERDRPIRDQGHRAGVIVVESDVWIGANVTVLRDVRVGQGAVVAAGAVVTADVERYTVVGGVPARFLKKRGESDVPA